MRKKVNDLCTERDRLTRERVRVLIANQRTRLGRV